MKLMRTSEFDPSQSARIVDHRDGVRCVLEDPISYDGVRAGHCRCDHL